MLYITPTSNEEDRKRRERIMAEANVAYENGDEGRLRELLQEWKSSPDSVKGEGIGSDLVRTIRKIALVRKRLTAIEGEMNNSQQSDLHVLMVKVSVASEEGRDLLGNLSDQLDSDINNARDRLSRLDADHE